MRRTGPRRSAPHAAQQDQAASRARVPPSPRCAEHAELSNEGIIIIGSRLTRASVPRAAP